MRYRVDYMWLFVLFVLVRIRHWIVLIMVWHYINLISLTSWLKFKWLLKLRFRLIFGDFH